MKFLIYMINHSEVIFQQIIKQCEARCLLPLNQYLTAVMRFNQNAKIRVWLTQRVCQYLFLRFILNRCDASIYVVSLKWEEVVHEREGKTTERCMHCLTQTWNKCGFLTNRLPLPKPTFRPLRGIKSIPRVSFLLAVWMRLWVKGVALCDWWAMAN